MSSVFDAVRLGAVALDVVAARAGQPAGHRAPAAGRLVALLDAALKGSVLCRELLRGQAGCEDAAGGAAGGAQTPADAPVRRLGHGPATAAGAIARVHRRSGKPPANRSSASTWSGEFGHHRRTGAVRTGRPGHGRLRCPGGIAAQQPAARAALRSTPCHWRTHRLCRRDQRPFRQLRVDAAVAPPEPVARQSMQCFSIAQPVAALVEQLNRFAPTIIAT